MFGGLGCLLSSLSQGGAAGGHVPGGGAGDGMGASPETEPGMKVRAKSNRSQASWPAVTLLRYEEVAAAGLWMKEARPWPWAAAQVRTPTAPIASAKVEPADISNITHSAVTSS